MPTLESVISSRVILTFIGLILLVPGLRGGFGGHFRPPWRPSCPWRHENRPDSSSVGCTTRSAPP